MAIILDNKIRFGRPIIEGTRITVEEILGALSGGMTTEDIVKEYGVTKENIKEALEYASEIISEERVGLIKK